MFAQQERSGVALERHMDEIEDLRWLNCVCGHLLDERRLQSRLLVPKGYWISPNRETTISMYHLRHTSSSSVTFFQCTRTHSKFKGLQFGVLAGQ